MFAKMGYLKSAIIFSGKNLPLMKGNFEKCHRIRLRTFF